MRCVLTSCLTSIQSKFRIHFLCPFSYFLALAFSIKVFTTGIYAHHQEFESPGYIQDWPKGGDNEKFQDKSASYERSELGHCVRKPVVFESAVERFQNILQLVVIMFNGKLIHVSVVPVDLEEWVDTPHEIVAERTKKSSLPIDQHCLHTFAVEVLEVFVVAKVEGDLSEHEIVGLRITVA